MSSFKHYKSIVQAARSGLRFNLLCRFPSKTDLCLGRLIFNNSVLINFNGAGHMPHVDYPAAFASAVETFMQHQSPDHEAMSPAGGG